MKKVAAITAAAAATALIAGILIGAASANRRPIRLIVDGMDAKDQNALRVMPSPTIVDDYVMIPAATLKWAFQDEVKWDAKARTISLRPDVLKGGLGYKGSDWPKVRNAVNAYLIALQEQQPSIAESVAPEFKSDLQLSGNAVMDIRFLDGAENETAGTYTVRVGLVMEEAGTRLWNRTYDFVLDKASLKLTRIHDVASKMIYEYAVLPGVFLTTPVEG